jgi:hypothetical protein
VKKKSFNTLIKINKKKYLLIKALKNKKITKTLKTKLSRDISLYTLYYYRKFSLKILKKFLLYFYYIQLLYINKTKFDYNYLQYLKFYLQKLYNKNVEFNLINLKRFDLNSDILYEIFTLKFTKNRNGLLKKLKKFAKKIKVKKTAIIKKKKLAYTTPNSFVSKNIQETIFKSLKYKYLSGFRFQAKGRLTKRYTAARSISKTRYEGNLLNLDSSFNG